ncbi:MAG: SpoIID/LytB domain-containing protein [Bacteroidetes bacterium]|nr:SpoIID/LytB domain-containing protein [Bacteroidota bacterium]
MNGNRLFYIVFFLLSHFTYSQQIRIGVMRDFAIKKIQFSHNIGNYTVFADSLMIGTLSTNEFFELTFEDELRVRVKKGSTDLGAYSKIVLIQNTPQTSITLTTKTPVAKVRKYKDDFEVIATNRELRIVNVADLENYLAGVVESEGGGKKHLEYYKVQAIMSRTYALDNSTKHENEGFNLCDRVHCQAYHSMNRFTPTIDTAVMMTQGVIMEDEHNELAEAFFHANCGGQTCMPEYVWNTSVPYLSTFKDTFCIYTKQSTWEKRLSKAEWRSFLVDQYQFPENDSVIGPFLYNFNQKDRTAFYVSPVLGIPLRDIRTRFNLKSTFFSSSLEGNEVVLKGRGYGHGVGLCQEGAMKMAVYDYSAEQIIRFYFPGINLWNIEEKWFYNQPALDILSFY